jgi:alpha-glucosidase
MYFRKYPYPSNFDFATQLGTRLSERIGPVRLAARIDRFAGDVFRIRVTSPQWRQHSIAGLTPPRKVALDRGDVRLQVDRSLALTLKDGRGRTLLAQPRGHAFGVSGRSSMFVFNHEEGDQFYGMGEKLLGLELSNKQTKFWNTDVFADFHWKEVFEDRADPLYASIPYLIIKRGNTYVGLLLDNPQATFISTGANLQVGGGQMDLGTPARKVITIGGEDGQPDLYILVGPSLPELTRKLQQLVGVTPLPPAWALGYNQCRWGYQSADDLQELDRKFRQHRIPCDALWLDIDYMDAFKVFTFNKAHFPALRKTLKDLKSKGRRIVPILDPGVKQQKGYPVYDDGRRRDIFCRNPQGGEFIGLVWPGETAFPDFSMPEGRAWWARHVQAFGEQGIDGAWIDMNDPSTGSVQNSSMLFQRGRLGHATFHNQYALGMAMATRDGFAAAHPGQRPFVISRSGYTGMSRHAALWTGDNCSNYHYLRQSIPCSLNLALSGVPFNGPDIGGFAGDCPANLLRDWQKAGFLFPFCRNHTATGTRRQEPWAYDALTLNVCRHYIRLRYKLRPYLYNLFLRHEESGEAILRPLFYDFADTPEFPLGRIEDQFMVGHAILQAPLVWENAKSRDLTLPGPAAWWSVLEGRWIKGPCRRKAAPGPLQTPLYVREGSIVPMSPGDPASNAYDPRRVEAHLFLRAGGRREAYAVYAYDDGATLKYREGRRSEVGIVARVRGRTLEIATEQLRRGYGPCRMSFVLYARFDRVIVNGRDVKPDASSWLFCGAKQKTWIVR